jgi:hypothetical protein
MDTLEQITLSNTVLEEELQFLSFVCQNPDVQIISSQLSLEGPAYLSLDDYREIKKTGTLDECNLLLWNTRIENPLCATPFLHLFDHNWSPTKPDHSKSINIPRNKNEFLALNKSFRKQSITDNLLRHSMYDRLLSPLVEISISSDITIEKSNDYFGILAEFCNWAHPVWVIWNTVEQKWEHETRNLEPLFDFHFEQPPEFIEWQENIFNWVRENWSNKIYSPSTYRLE